mgnify:CR=1 FL=1
MATPGTKQRNRSRRPQTERRPGQGGVVTRVNVRNGDPQSISTPPVTGASNTDTGVVDTAPVVAGPAAPATAGMTSDAAQTSGAGAVKLASTPPPQAPGQFLPVSNTAFMEASQHEIKAQQAKDENKPKDAQAHASLYRLKTTQANGSGGGLSLGPGIFGVAGQLAAATTATIDKDATGGTPDPEVKPKPEAKPDPKAKPDPEVKPEVEAEPGEAKPATGEVLARKFGPEHLRGLDPGSPEWREAINAERVEARQQKMSVAELRRKKEERHTAESLTLREKIRAEGQAEQAELRDVASEVRIAKAKKEAEIAAGVGDHKDPDDADRVKRANDAKLTEVTNRAQERIPAGKLDRLNKQQVRLQSRRSRLQGNLDRVVEGDKAASDREWKELGRRLENEQGLLAKEEERLEQLRGKAEVMKLKLGDEPGSKGGPEEAKAINAQEHVHRQERLIGSIKRRIEATAGKIRKAQEAPTDPNPKVASLEKAIKALDKQLSQIAEAKAPLEERIDALRQSTAEAYEAVSGTTPEPSPVVSAADQAANAAAAAIARQEMARMGGTFAAPITPEDRGSDTDFWGAWGGEDILPGATAAENPVVAAAKGKGNGTPSKKTQSNETQSKNTPPKTIQQEYNDMPTKDLTAEAIELGLIKR